MELLGLVPSSSFSRQNPRVGGNRDSEPRSQRWASSCSGYALGVLAEWAADGGLIPLPPGSPTLFPQPRNFGFPAGDPT